MTSHNQPLAARMRPATLDDIVGQDHLTSPGSPLRSIVDGASQTSVLLWGGPGTGKTSIARVISQSTHQRFLELSATSATVKEVRDVFARARALRASDGTGTILFLDEIHRFAKSQQDILLPAVEDGTIALIGATTENPSFSVIPALMSRAVLIQLQPLEEAGITTICRRALNDPRGLPDFTIDDEAIGQLARLASGDARRALTVLEMATGRAGSAGRDTVSLEDIQSAAPGAVLTYDKTGDQHYDITSAFIKSMRGSDPDAALHWMARMLAAGEDPRFVARRLIVHASEDVGMADPNVLAIAVAAAQAVQLVGMPEARINLAQAVIAIATAPKSPSVIKAVNAAFDDVEQGRTGPVPAHLRDAHYPGAKALGHGAGYLYPHDYPRGVVAQSYLPDGIADTDYYQPTTNGFEATIANRLAAIKNLTKD